MKLILDCDPGLDDAVAILVAARYADLIGITTVAGNVGINRTTRNALVVAQLAGLDLPVHRGAAKSLAGPAVDGSRIHGETGLGNAVLPDLDRSEASDDAVGYICDTARSVDDLHLLAIGPLTNVALAIERDPDLRHHLAGLTIMGGSAGVLAGIRPLGAPASPPASGHWVRRRPRRHPGRFRRALTHSGQRSAPPADSCRSGAGPDGRLHRPRLART